RSAAPVPSPGTQKLAAEAAPASSAESPSGRRMMPPMPHPTHSLILPILPERWAPPRHAIALDGMQLAPKPELHITLLGRTLHAELRATLGSDADAVIAAARNAQDWRFERSGRCLLLCKPFVEDGRAGIAHSLVELVHLPAMTPFHRALGRLLGRQLP